MIVSVQLPPATPVRLIVAAPPLAVRFEAVAMPLHPDVVNVPPPNPVCDTLNDVVAVVLGRLSVAGVPSPEIVTGP